MKGSVRRPIVFLLLLLPICFGSLWAEDCRLRGFDGSQIVKFDCQDAATFASAPSSLRVTLPSDGTIHGVSLVGQGAWVKSKFRVHLPNGTLMALGIVGITTCEELQMISYHASYLRNQSFQLGGDIDCSATNKYIGDPALNILNPKHATSLWGMGYYEFYGHKGFDGIAGYNPVTKFNDDNLANLSPADLGGKGFRPLGYWPYASSAQAFSGKLFDGKGHTITGLTINRPADNGIGLFGGIVGVAIQNLGLVDGNVSGGTWTGGLAGRSASSTITDCYFKGTVIGGTAGGLVGTGGTDIIHSYFSGTVTGSMEVGGLAGGGCTITSSYSSGSVSGGYYIGGLVGMPGGSITNSYSTGTVTGDYSVGGLTGHGGAVISNSYSTRTVTGPGGGLVGYGGGGDLVITNSFSTGTTSGGGLIGDYCNPVCSTNTSPKTFTNNWWYNGTSTQATNSNCTSVPGLIATSVDDFHGTGSGTGGGVYNNWDFTNTWVAVPGGFPHLKCAVGQTWDSTAGACH